MSRRLTLPALAPSTFDVGIMDYPGVAGKEDAIQHAIESAATGGAGSEVTVFRDLLWLRPMINATQGTLATNHSKGGGLDPVLDPYSIGAPSPAPGHAYAQDARSPGGSRLQSPLCSRHRWL